MDITLKADAAIKELGRLVTNIPKEMAIINRATSKRGRSIVAKRVTSEIKVTQKAVRKQISIYDRKEKGATVSLSKTKRISLKEFGARQIKTGVSYRIKKKGGRELAAGAFTGPKPGLTTIKLRGHVFKRVGKERFPIVKLQGPSPWGVLIKNNRRKRVGGQIKTELFKQINRRLRYRRLKANGVI